MDERSKAGVAHRRHAPLALAAVVFAAVGAALYRFPPDRYGFYPQCPIHAYTGLLCPGCGATRALAALVHGHVAEAMHWNGLVVALLPVLVAYGMTAWKRGVWPRVPTTAIYAGLAVALVFDVARNVA